MYLGVDVGGTKTLVAVLDNHGVIREQLKFLTPKNYDHWLLELRHCLANFEHKDFKGAGVGRPGNPDRGKNLPIGFGNVPWVNVDPQVDVEDIAKCPTFMENDAKLAGLSEWMVLDEPNCHSMLYVTVSTGIGFTLIRDGVININIGDAGGKALLLEHRGKMVSWESFASGRALYERYKTKAKDIHDPKIWKNFTRYLAQGIIQLIAVTEPDVIVFGGGVGTYFDRWGKILEEQLEDYNLPVVRLPKLRGAKRAEYAVVYGCYDYAKQQLGILHGTNNN